MNEEAPHGRHEHDQHGDQAARRGQRIGHAEDASRDQAAQPDEHVVDRMRTRADQEVDMLRAVVDGMEAPQKRDLMGPAMAPVETDFADDEPYENTLPERPGRDRCLETVDDRAGSLKTSRFYSQSRIKPKVCADTDHRENDGMAVGRLEMIDEIYYLICFNIDGCLIVLFNFFN